MSVRQYTLTITAAAQPLSNAIAVDPSRGGPRDEAMHQIILSTETDCFIGDPSVTTSLYGKKLFADTASTEPLVIGPFEAGAVKLSEIYVVGTSGVLHILAFPY